MQDKYRDSEVVANLHAAVFGRTCPLTAGQATRMPLATFRRMCQVKQAEASEFGYEGKLKRQGPAGRCGVCKGESIPEEIEIIPLKEMMMVSAASKQGTCELCGDRSSLRKNHNMSVCGKCQALQSNVNMRPDVVIKALKIMKPEMLAGLIGETVAVDVESASLKRIAEIVGYAGTDGEGLIDEVKGLFSYNKALLIESRAYAEPNPDIIRAMDLEGSASWPMVTMAVLQTAALLEDYQTAESPWDKVEIDDHKQLMAKLEASEAWLQQIIASAGDEIGIPSLPPCELVPQIRALRAAAGYYATVPLQVEERVVNQVRQDGPNIEISLGGLSIRVSGVTGLDSDSVAIVRDDV